MMTTVPLTIRVAPRVAEAYRAASDGDRLKMEILFGLNVGRVLDPPTESLSEVIGRMSREAERNGLTPEILEAALKRMPMYERAAAIAAKQAAAGETAA